MSGPVEAAAWRLKLRDTVLELSAGAPLLMGVVNASPESFSDGADAASLDRQLERAGELLAQGASIVDVGGESGVTNAEPIPAREEIRRILPLVEELVAVGAIVSVDTWKAPVALAALQAGAHLVNDVSGLRDATVADHCARFGAGLVVMHTRARPKVKEFPSYDDVVADVRRFLEQQMAVAVERGVSREQVLLDPGPDFAKSPAETVRVLRHLDDLRPLGRPILLAVSRKDFIGAVTLRSPSRRLAGTLAAVGEGVDAGAAILRVHDVEATSDFLAVRAALRGTATVDPALHLPEQLRREPTGDPNGSRSTERPVSSR